MTEDYALPLLAENPEQFQAFTARGDDGPVVMLNLLKFKPNGGAEMYARYGVSVGPMVAALGGRSIFTGTPAELLIGGQEWDSIALVEYPSRRAFIEMVTSPEYRAVEHLRADSLERSVLYALDPRTPAGA